MLVLRLQNLSNAVQILMQENQQLKQNLGGVRNVVTQDVTGRFYDTLDRELPDWEITNHDQEFVRWLDNVIRFQVVFVKTFYQVKHTGTMKLSRVLNIIKGYRSERAAVNPAGNLQPTMGNGNGADRSIPQFELQSLAAPGRAKIRAACYAPRSTVYHAMISLGLCRCD